MAQDHYAALFTKLSEEGFDSREFVRRLVERGLQDLIDAGVAAHIGADPHERTARRTNRLWRQAHPHPPPPRPATSRSTCPSCARAAGSRSS